MQRTKGIYAILGHPWVYEIFMSIIGAKRKRQILVEEYIRPFPGMRMLDCGCGPAEIVPLLSDVDYMGIDLSSEYINQANEKYGDHARFQVQSADDIAVSGEKFDLVMALGLVHHLDDEQTIKLFETVRSVLAPDGRFFTFDGVFVDEQSYCARYFLNRDRGKHVRTKSEYEILAASVFGKERVISSVRNDMTRIPYTHLIMECNVGCSMEKTPYE